MFVKLNNDLKMLTRTNTRGGVQQKGSAKPDSPLEVANSLISEAPGQTANASENYN